VPGDGVDVAGLGNELPRSASAAGTTGGAVAVFTLGRQTMLLFGSVVSDDEEEEVGLVKAECA
jgi:hypothetical protein